jgi:hypothetical protein
MAPAAVSTLAARLQHRAPDRNASVPSPTRSFRVVHGYTQSGEPVGLVEASLRTDYVNGMNTSSVVFLEGLYVAPSHRRQEGRLLRLVAAVADWAAGN